MPNNSANPLSGSHEALTDYVIPLPIRESLPSSDTVQRRRSSNQNFLSPQARDLAKVCRVLVLIQRPRVANPMAQVACVARLICMVPSDACIHTTVYFFFSLLCGSVCR